MGVWNHAHQKARPKVASGMGGNLFVSPHEESMNSVLLVDPRAPILLAMNRK